MRIKTISAVILALVCSRMLVGQIFVDVGGPRDIFFANAEFKGLKSKFDTADKSLALSYFGQPVEKKAFIAGMSAKIAAIDGVEELFKFERWPTLELSVLGTWWGKRDLKPDNQALIWSITPRISGTYAEYVLVDTDPSQNPRKVRKESFTTGTASVTVSFILPFDFGLGLSGGLSRESNYADLTKVEITPTGGKLADGTAVEGIGKKTTAHLGTLTKHTTFPLFLTVTKVVPANPIGDLIPGSAKDSAYDIVIAPYFKLTPRDGGEPQNAVGLNLALRALTNTLREAVGEKKAGDPSKAPDEQKLSFPYSFFVERRNVSTSAKSETKAGASVVFEWK